MPKATQIAAKLELEAKPRAASQGFFCHPVLQVQNNRTENKLKVHH